LPVNNYSSTITALPTEGGKSTVGAAPFIAATQTMIRRRS
jgi:hypothetical protein